MNFTLIRAVLYVVLMLTLLAQALKECGDDPAEVKRWLYSVKDYEGVSGSFSIDQNGDGVRKHALKRIVHGQVETLHE
jgi:ABC-type branched-subunit amino acid transport system substrate-binding protein